MFRARKSSKPVNLVILSHESALKAPMNVHTRVRPPDGSPRPDPTTSPQVLCHKEGATELGGVICVAHQPGLQTAQLRTV